MKRFALAALVVLSCAALAAPAQAYGGRGRGDHFSLSLGFGCCGYYPYYSPYYYGYPAYYAPTYYAAPPATVVYAQPAPVTYVAPQTAAPQQMQPLPASQASASFVDGQGRTCRNFQTTIDGSPINGTACLQPDGSWRTVAE